MSSVGMGPSAQLCQGTYDVVKTVLLLAYWCLDRFNCYKSFVFPLPSINKNFFTTLPKGLAHSCTKAILELNLPQGHNILVLYVFCTFLYVDHHIISDVPVHFKLVIIISMMNYGFIHIHTCDGTGSWSDPISWQTTLSLSLQKTWMADINNGKLCITRHVNTFSPAMEVILKKIKNKQYYRPFL